MSCNLPKISLIMSLYNAETFLRKALESLIKQEYSNLELIVIDGGSKDKTLEILESYKSFINILVCERDYGLYHALNKGILLASGEYICFLNGDDFYFENAFEKVGKYLSEHPEVDLLYGDAAHVDTNENFLGWHGAEAFNKSKLLHERCYIPFQATFIKRSALAYTGIFNAKLKGCADWNLWKEFAISEGKFKLQFLDEKIGAWRLHDNTITSGNKSSREMYLRALENFKSSRKYSEKFISKIELKQIPFMIVGLLGLRSFLKTVRDKYLK